MTPTINDIKDLVRQERWDEARQLLRTVLNDPKEVEASSGEAYTKMMLTYLGALAEERLQYLNMLDTAISVVRGLKRREQEMNDQFDLAKVRLEIDHMRGGSTS